MTQFIYEVGQSGVISLLLFLPLEITDMTSDAFFFFLISKA